MCIEYYKYYLITLNCLSRLSKGEEERERDNAQKSSCEWMIDDHMYIIVEQRECQQRHTIQNRTGNFNSNEIAPRGLKLIYYYISMENSSRRCR